jgi:hypothetical protein
MRVNSRTVRALVFSAVPVEPMGASGEWSDSLDSGGANFVTAGDARPFAPLLSR